MAYDIRYPEKQSEFEVQAEAYFILRNAGYDVRAEIKAKNTQKGQRGARFDLLVFDPETKDPLLIIEVKPRTALYNLPLKQKLRYEAETGLECLVVRGEQGCQTLLTDVAKRVSPSNKL